MVPLLNEEILQLGLVNKQHEKIDSLRRIQITNYNKIIEDKTNSIEGLEKSLKKKNRAIGIGSLVAGILIVIGILT